MDGTAQVGGLTRLVRTLEKLKATSCRVMLKLMKMLTARICPVQDVSRLTDIIQYGDSCLRRSLWYQLPGLEVAWFRQGLLDAEDQTSHPAVLGKVPCGQCGCVLATQFVLRLMESGCYQLGYAGDMRQHKESKLTSHDCPI